MKKQAEKRRPQQRAEYAQAQTGERGLEPGNVNVNRVGVRRHR